MNKDSDSPKMKIGLALGSGSARGLAHIGVIKALTEEGIHIDYMAGTSIGALIGAVYVGGGLDRLEEFMHTVDWKMIASYCDFVFPRVGLLQGGKINRFIDRFLPAKTFEETNIPLTVVATDLITGEEVLFKKGDLVQAVRASISLPGIFQPVKYNGTYLVDGGLVNPVPANIVKAMGADFVLAVDLSLDVATRNVGKRKLKTLRRKNKTKPVKRRRRTLKEEQSTWVFKKLEEKYRSVETSVKKTINNWKDDTPPVEEPEEPNIFDVMASSLNIMGYHITQRNLEFYKPDILLQPEISYIGLFDYDEAKSIIDEGYQQTKERIDNILMAIENNGKEIISE
ncbi:MAG TPA: patatin-like phospholipase family protein [Balneolales bacterium]|nr:patatin-like phospholipase family protein [Balneolales bacterium]